MPLRSPPVRELGRSMIPFLVLGAGIHATPIIERFYASRLPDGELSYLGYASKISSIMMALLGTGIATAIFPAMTRTHEASEGTGLVQALEYGFRLTVAVGLPVLAILSGLAVPIITVLFEGGAFQRVATLGVSRVIPIVLVGDLVFPMMTNLVERAYYAARDSHTVPIVATARSGLYWVGAAVLVDVWGYRGLAWAQTLVTGLTLSVLLCLLRRRLGFRFGTIIGHTWVSGSASLLAFLAARLISSSLSFFPPLLRLSAGGAVAMALYIVVLYRADESTAREVLEITGVKQLISRGRTLAGPQ